MKIAIEGNDCMIMCNRQELAAVYGGLSAVDKLRQEGLFPENPESDQAFKYISNTVILIEKALGK